MKIIDDVRSFLKKHERVVSPVAIIGGFIVDIFTLNRIDQFFDNAILIAHLLVVGIAIVLVFAQAGDRWAGIRRRLPIVHAIMAFSFGGLFSGFFLFYVRSGSFISSAPFILLLLFLMLGAEFFKKYYQRITFQLAIYYTAIFSYLIFFIPLVTGQIGAGWFMVSAVISLIVIALFLLLLRRVNHSFFLEYRNKVALAIASVFVIFTGLYFLRVIPPVPLSLKFNAVFHQVRPIGSFRYQVVYEPAKKIQVFRDYSHTFHWQSGERVYVFTSIFAPPNISTDIYHRWEHFDESKNRWVTEGARIQLPIQGGRDGGYRTYSFKTSIEPGRWRVAVTNKRGQVLGYVKFRVVPLDPVIGYPYGLETKKL